MIAEVNKNVVKSFGKILEQVVGPGAARQYTLPQMAFRLAADLRPSADGSAHPRRPASCRQPGQRAHSRAGTDRRTDGRITVSLNARYGGGIKSCHLP